MVSVYHFFREFYNSIRRCPRHSSRQAEPDEEPAPFGPPSRPDSCWKMGGVEDAVDPGRITQGGKPVLGGSDHKQDRFFMDRKCAHIRFSSESPTSLPMQVSTRKGQGGQRWRKSTGATPFFRHGRLIPLQWRIGKDTYTRYSTKSR